MVSLGGGRMVGIINLINTIHNGGTATYTRCNCLGYNYIKIAIGGDSNWTIMELLID